MFKKNMQTVYNGSMTSKDKIIVIHIKKVLQNDMKNSNENTIKKCNKKTFFKFKLVYFEANAMG
jgi:hypothetical protein